MVVDCRRLISFPHIDAWLKGALDYDIPPLPGSALASHSARERTARNLAWRILNLSALLLQAAKIPVFDPGKILTARANAANAVVWDVTVAQPRVDRLPIDPYMPALKLSTVVIKWLIDQPLNAANKEQLYQTLNEQFVSKVGAQAHGGDSTIAVLHEAWKLGIEFRHLGLGTYQLGLGASQLRVDRGAVQFDSAIGARISTDKWRATNLMRDAGLPAPTNAVAASIDDARAIAAQLGWPLVVKPLDRDRGEGVSVNIRSNEALDAAVTQALALSRAALVEVQVAGICHRVLVTQGRVRLVAKRLPKSVKGDGRSTVRELVDRANAEEASRPTWSRLKPFPLDELAISSLAAAGLTPDSVPEPDVVAPLRPIQTSAWGGVVDDFTGRIHPANEAIAIKAARLFGLSVAGIDIITTDITRPWSETGAIINEVNFSPLLSGRTSGDIVANIIDELIPERGRIPVEVVLGEGAALTEGQRIQAGYASRGVRCWLVSDADVIAANGEPANLVTSGLYERCLAVLMDAEVEALVIVVRTDEFLSTGLPVRTIDRVTETPLQENTAAPWRKQVSRLLKQHLVPNEARQTEAR